jgi:hypothetical protein
VSTNPRQLHRRPASRPAVRTVDIAIDKGDFAGWEATARADFPARLLADLQSGQIERIIAVLDAIIVDHNFPNSQDELAERMGDVDPYAGLMEAASAVFDAIAKLPNR